MASVPPVDDINDGMMGESTRQSESELLQLRLLDAEAQSRENVNREAEQRYSLRYWSVILTSFLILIFMFFFCHIFFNINNLIANVKHPVTIVALYVAPIGAIVTLTISLLLASFRGLPAQDEAVAASVGMEGLKFGSGMQ